MVKILAERAPAKINLCLRVTGRRANGYHELDSIFIPIDWSDLVRIEIRPASALRIDLRCNRPELSDPGLNLAARAATAFAREYDLSAHIMIDLEKHLPAGAGLGGGSSDAGTVLRMLAAMCTAAADARLARVAVSIGADVPFFLDPRAARVRGIGERIEPLPAIAPIHLVLAVPAIEVPTAKVFRALAPGDWSGEIPAADLEAILGGRISRGLTVNDLAKPAAAMYPRIAELRAIVETRGAIAAAMSGSGGSVFGIFPDRGAAQDAAKLIASDAPDARVVACQTLGGVFG
ncbi:MAG: 4-(cytidine 5'-diphospho)-2-C-methyl-D-erythritol kinase [Candidatus Binataceae bacterium]